VGNNTIGKDLLLSKSFWGLIILLFALGLQYGGYQIDVNNIMAIGMQIIGFSLGIYGRITASKAITSVAGVKLP
jgi:hypothetical protein